MLQADMSFRAAAQECRRRAARTTDPVERQELNGSMVETRTTEASTWKAHLRGIVLRHKPRRL